jgi:polysaccharide biosynthesis/export protein
VELKSKFAFVSGFCALVGLLALVLTGCTDVPNLPAAPAAAPDGSEYRVQPGDTLDVKFLYNPELNEQPTVQPDGRISMQFAQNLEAGGRTTEEVRQALSEAYSHELVKPGVSVAIKGPVSWRIYIGGEVNAPGMFADSGPPLTLTQAIARAGGIKDTGDPKKIVLLRRVGSDAKAYMLNFSAAATGRVPADDVRLASYDALYVPRTGVADVYTAYNQYFKQFLPNNFGLNYGIP